MNNYYIDEYKRGQTRNFLFEFYDHNYELVKVYYYTLNKDWLDFENIENGSYRFFRHRGELDDERPSLSIPIKRQYYVSWIIDYLKSCGQVILDPYEKTNGVSNYFLYPMMGITYDVAIVIPYEKLLTEHGLIYNTNYSLLALGEWIPKNHTKNIEKTQLNFLLNKLNFKIKNHDKHKRRISVCS